MESSLFFINNGNRLICSANQTLQSRQISVINKHCGEPARFFNPFSTELSTIFGVINIQNRTHLLPKSPAPKKFGRSCRPTRLPKLTRQPRPSRQP